MDCSFTLAFGEGVMLWDVVDAAREEWRVTLWAACADLLCCRQELRTSVKILYAAVNLRRV